MSFGKLFVAIGIVLVVIGAAMWKTGGLGHLPRDFTGTALCRKEIPCAPVIRA